MALRFLSCSPKPLHSASSESRNPLMRGREPVVDIDGFESVISRFSPWHKANLIKPDKLW